ncbi:MAG: SAM-dependent DNA methyltransferase, partial [Bacilli bacterium]|nr:SAM-dependent DNA methyltransferase [Bacilli bacterium]
MNKQELASKIWTLANSLRGKVSAATYKDYMLGFLFYKYLSDREETYLIEKLDFEREELGDVTEDDDQLKNNCMSNLGYFIAYDHLFSTWVSLDVDFSIKNVTEALSAFERYIGQAYKKVFSGIFSTLSARLTDLGTTDLERTKNSREIIKLVKSIPTDNKEDYDVLGFIYEFLLKNFAANAGKAGEFY